LTIITEYLYNCNSWKKCSASWIYNYSRYYIISASFTFSTNHCI